MIQVSRPLDLPERLTMRREGSERGSISSHCPDVHPVCCRDLCCMKTVLVPSSLWGHYQDTLPSLFWGPYNATCALCT